MKWLIIAALGLVAIWFLWKRGTFSGASAPSSSGWGAGSSGNVAAPPVTNAGGFHFDLNPKSAVTIATAPLWVPTVAAIDVGKSVYHSIGGLF